MSYNFPRLYQASATAVRDLALESDRRHSPASALPITLQKGEGTQGVVSFLFSTTGKGRERTRTECTVAEIAPGRATVAAGRAPAAAVAAPARVLAPANAFRASTVLKAEF